MCSIMSQINKLKVRIPVFTGAYRKFIEHIGAYEFCKNNNYSFKNDEKYFLFHVKMLFSFLRCSHVRPDFLVMQ